MDLYKPLYYGTQASLAADWLQTRDIASRPDRFEANPLLGKNPSMGLVNGYFIGAMLANHYIPDYMVNEWGLSKDVVNLVRTGLLMQQLGSIINNRMIGVNFRF